MIEMIKGVWRSCKAKIGKGHDNAPKSTRDPLPAHLIMQIGQELLLASQKKTLGRLMLASRTTCEPLQEMLYRDITVNSLSSACVLLHATSAVSPDTILEVGKHSPASLREARRRQKSPGVKPANGYRKSLALIKTLAFEDMDYCPYTGCFLRYFVRVDPQHRLRPFPNLESVIIRNLGNDPTFILWSLERRYYYQLGAVLQPTSICVLDDLKAATARTRRLYPHLVPTVLYKSFLVVHGARAATGKWLPVHHHICSSHDREQQRRLDALSVDHRLTPYIAHEPCPHCGDQQYLDVQIGKENAHSNWSPDHSPLDPTSSKIARRLARGCPYAVQRWHLWVYKSPMG